MDMTMVMTIGIYVIQPHLLNLMVMTIMDDIMLQSLGNTGSMYEPY